MYRMEAKIKTEKNEDKRKSKSDMLRRNGSVKQNP